MKIAILDDYQDAVRRIVAAIPSSPTPASRNFLRAKARAFQATIRFLRQQQENRSVRRARIAHRD